MKSPEQMGTQPEQPKEEPMAEQQKEEIAETPAKPETERKITTPEEAAEMTRQRRKEFGLEERPEKLSPEAVEELDEAIKKLLKDLYSYACDYENFSPEIQEEWDKVEQEAMVGIDREIALIQLQTFVIKLFLEAVRKRIEKPEE